MNKPGIVFIHGWGVNERIWQDFIQRFFADHRTQSLALKLNHEQQQSAGSVLEQEAARLSLQLSAPCVVVAWSFGAHVAICLAERYPDKVQQLILLAANPCFNQRPDWPYGVEPRAIDKMIQQLHLDKQKTLQRFYALISRGTTNHKLQLETLMSFGFAETLGIDELKSGLNCLRRLDLRQTLFGLNIPVLFCYGEFDRLINPAIGDDQRFVEAAIETRLIEGADHLPFLSQPENTAGIIRQRTGLIA